MGRERAREVVADGVGPLVSNVGLRATKASAKVQWHVRSVMLLMVILVALTGCTVNGESPASNSSPELDENGSATPEGTPEQAARVPCEDGRLLIMDLPAIDGQWGPGLEAAYQRAVAWQEDARLVAFRVTCELFEPGFRWQATYYSADAQAMFSTDSRESRPIDLEPEDIPSLDVSQLSFHDIRESLLSYDYPDDTELQPSSGVDIRVNSAALPFGPPEAPLNQTMAHVSLEFRGEIKDLFIDTASGEIFQFASPSR